MFLQLVKFLFNRSIKKQYENKVNIVFEVLGKIIWQSKSMEKEGRIRDPEGLNIETSSIIKDDQIKLKEDPASAHTIGNG